MKYSAQIKPINYIKAKLTELVREIAGSRTPIVITENGEAKAVLQAIATYEETHETLALLKILAFGNAEIEQAQVVSAENAIKRLRSKPRTEE